MPGFEPGTLKITTGGHPSKYWLGSTLLNFSVRSLKLSSVEPSQYLDGWPTVVIFRVPGSIPRPGIFKNLPFNLGFQTTFFFHPQSIKINPRGVPVKVFEVLFKSLSTCCGLESLRDFSWQVGGSYVFDNALRSILGYKCKRHHDIAHDRNKIVRYRFLQNYI